MAKYIPFTWRRLLKTIHEMGPSRIINLAKYLDVSKSNVRNKIASLLVWSLICRVDRTNRYLGYTITEKGILKIKEWEKENLDIDMIKPKASPCEKCYYQDWLEKSGVTPEALRKAEDDGRRSS